MNETKKFLKQNSNLIITRADKGNATVVMNRNDYQRRIEAVVSEINTYKILTADPTKNIEKLVNRLLDEWTKKEYISGSYCKRLKVHNGFPPRLYGLPKIHKEGLPLRPIASSIGSPVYEFSKLLIHPIEKITRLRYSSVKDSWDLVNKIKSFVVPDNYTVFSLDVVSLFTNISKELVVKCINNKWD